MMRHGWRWLAAAAWMLLVASPLAAQTPAGTAFSYQGRLTDGGATASGVYDVRFTLFDAATGAGTIGSPVVVDDVTVTSGLFTVLLDFGAAAFSGDARWLEIAGFVAKWTGSAWSCALDADATGLDWKLMGNAGTGGAAVLGTSDAAPLTLIVNNDPVLRISDDGDGPRMIGGHRLNTGAFDGATIAGGGSGFDPNVVTALFGTIGGGSGNQAAQNATVAGGTNNRATNLTATVAGGGGNTASGMTSTVGGGAGNGSFVWGDIQNNSISSPGPNTFTVRANGGIWFGGTGPASIPAGQYIAMTTGGYLSLGGTWTNSSDRNLKQGFDPNDGARLPITSWSYKATPSVRHIGPVAQAHATAQDAQLAALQAVVQELQHRMSSGSREGQR